MIGKLANAAGYQMVWFASIIGAARGFAFAGPIVALGFIASVLAFSGSRQADLRMLPLALAIGLLTDSAWIALGLLHFASPWPLAWLAPAWMLCLWMAFALTLNHSLSALKGHPLLNVVLGAVGGPLAYWAAAHGFGAVHFDAPLAVALSGIGIGWATCFPLLVRAAEGKHGQPARSEAS